MRKPKYRYNPATCRYELVVLRVRDVMTPLFVFLLVACSLFISLLFLHSAFFTTDKEQALIRENHELSRHHKQLKEELITVRASLSSLFEEDQKVEKRWVADQTPALALNQLFASTNRKHVADFKRQLQRTRQKTYSALETVNHSNYLLGTSITIGLDEIGTLMNVPSIQPVVNEELTKLASGYGVRTNPFHKGNYQHRGVDFVGPRGTPVMATASGTVTEIEKGELQMGYGNSIEIDHGNGFVTRYMHLGDILVKPGQKVVKGSTIALIGLSGGSIAPHVHYEVLRNNRHIDPIHFMLENVNSTDHVALLHLAKLKNQSLD
jgi:murein DD-endopeptidase MepM/ murein hydrolase activator NlpD